jgi:hypothetical protein
MVAETGLERHSCLRTVSLSITPTGVWKQDLRYDLAVTFRHRQETLISNHTSAK